MAILRLELTPQSYFEQFTHYCTEAVPYVRGGLMCANLVGKSAQMVSFCASESSAVAIRCSQAASGIGKVTGIARMAFVPLITQTGYNAVTTWVAQESFVPTAQGVKDLADTGFAWCSLAGRVTAHPLPQVGSAVCWAISDAADLTKALFTKQEDKMHLLGFKVMRAVLSFFLGICTLLALVLGGALLSPPVSCGIGLATAALSTATYFLKKN